MFSAALEQEFQNCELLEWYGIDLLTVEAINIEKLKLRPAAYSLFKVCMLARRTFLQLDPDRCSRICAEWEQEIGSGLHFFWNSARMEVDKSALPLDEFAYEVFRNIGSLLEATMLPYLRELLHLHEALHGSALKKTEVAAMDFGRVVHKLETWITPELLRPQPQNLPINQWRNIAQHFSVTQLSDRIACHFGKGPRRTIELTRQELRDVLLTLLSIHSALRTAHTIFFLDHGSILAKYCTGYARKDSDLQFQFIVGAASQGFEVTSLSVGEKEAKATLKDCTTANAKNRGIHASQFVLGLWIATQTDQVEIEYLTKAGIPYLRARASSGDCKLVHSGERDIGHLANAVALTLLNEVEASTLNQEQPPPA